MRLGGIGIATVNIRAWDGSTWRNLPVHTDTHPNLRVALYDAGLSTRTFSGSADGKSVAATGLCTQSFLYGFNGVSWDRLRSDANMHLCVNIGGLATLNHGQVTVGSTATAIRAVNASRKAITVKNIGASAVYLGGTVVTVGNGFKLEAGEALNDIRTTAGVRGICATGETTKVCYWEE